MTEPALLTTRDAHTLEFALNRPASRNALDEPLVDELARGLEAAAGDRTVRVIVLSGRGGSFCSGVDLRSASNDLDSDERLALRIAGFHRVIRAIARAPQPVIAAVDGPAVGFGADLALACDLRLASDAAYFEEKFVAIGLMPDGGGTFHLPRLVGTARALEHLLLGTRIDAAQACALGIVSRVLPRTDLEAETKALAARIALGPPLAITAIKRAVRDALASNLDTALDRERDGQLALLRSADVREGIRAFFERRAPSFRGE